MINIKTQSEFAKIYGVENSTLSNWNKLIQKREIIPDTRRWAQQLTKNILFKLYKNALDTANPQSIKLWFQVVHGWNPNQKQEAGYQGVTEFNISLAKVVKATN